MTREDIENIIELICPNDADYERPIISPKYLKQELEQMALEQEPASGRGLHLSQRFKDWQFIQETKTGHWILDETDNSITCDKCGCLIWANDISNGEAYYCPNCGCRMVEPQESEDEG